MKHLKTYEDNNRIPIPDGEYIIINPDKIKVSISREWFEFIKNNIGKIVSHYNVDNHLIYIIDFNSGIDDGHRRFEHEEIKRLATPEEIKDSKIKIAAKEFNI